MDLAGLNNAQKAAVEATEGRVRVVAGAGSGKTRTLAYRYAYIVNELGISPANILCLTFTNKAAQEMKFRISQLIPPGYANDFICTIHGFCVKFLREEIFRLGYPKNFIILDEEDMKYLAKQVLTETGEDRTVKNVRDLLNSLSEVKSKMTETEGENNGYIKTYLLNSSKISEDRSQMKSALRLLLKQGDKLALDFQDLINFTIYILNSFPDVLSQWQQKMNYVMVDEAQDCNNSDWQLVEMLSASSNNLFIVGDPDQSIYEWRGARPQMFVSFKADKDIILDENYRSTPGILDVANSIIRNNRNRIDKNMFTKNDIGESIIHFHAKNEQEEVNWVVQEILKRIDKGAIYSDFAILFRSAHLSRNIEQALIRFNIPYVMWGGTRFFERKEIKDCISYLRLVCSDDDLALERIINVPSRKVGEKTLKAIENFAKQDDSSYYAAIKKHLDEIGRPALKEFVYIIEKFRAQSKTSSVSAIMEEILQMTGLREEYRDDNDEQRLENIAELLSSMKVYETSHTEYYIGPLDDYIQDIALYTNADYKKDGRKIKLMTVHQSKGLEFPFVFIIELTDGIFPNARSLRERQVNALEEERRLMYVAATRAEKCLFMTESEGFNAQSNQDKLPSRFISEIKRNLFVTEGNLDCEIWNRLEQRIALENIQWETEANKDNDAFMFPYQSGRSVVHKVFGKGIILELTAEDTCKVHFENGAIRCIKSSFLLPYSDDCTS